MTRIAIKQETLEIALVELQECKSVDDNNRGRHQAITAIKQALAAPTVQEPIGYFTVNDYDMWEQIDGTSGKPLYDHPAAQPAPVEPDWKAEYLKSVESGCITLDELREARAELAVIKQALAAQQEHEPENEPFVSLASVQEPVQEPVGLIDRLTNPEQHYEFTDPKKANAVLMSLCQEAADALAAPVQATMKLESSGPGHGPAPNQKLSVRHVSLIDAGKTPPVQPAVPDALNPKDENPAYAAGWNDCRAEMLKGNTP